ncbi:adenosine receptor A2b-like [Glandiceps talaboti]
MSGDHADDEHLSHFSLMMKLTMNTSESLIGINGSGNGTDVMCDPNRTLAYIIVTITTTAIISTIIFGNALVILSIYRFQALKTINNYFICSLACADLFATLSAVSNAGMALGTIPNYGSIYYCMLLATVFQQGCQISIIHLLVIAIDRHLAITSPLTYLVKMTPRRAKWTIFLIWIIPVLYLTVVFPCIQAINDIDFEDVQCDMRGIIPPEFITVWAVMFFVAPFIIMFIIYLHIFCIAKKHSRQIAVQQHTFETATFKKALKATKTLAIVIGAFAICWIPFATMVSIVSIPTAECGTPWLFYIVFSIAVSNSAVNPVIYAWRNRDFRESFIKLLTRK